MRVYINCLFHWNKHLFYQFTSLLSLRFFIESFWFFYFILQSFACFLFSQVFVISYLIIFLPSSNNLWIIVMLKIILKDFKLIKRQKHFILNLTIHFLVIIFLLCRDIFLFSTSKIILSKFIGRPFTECTTLLTFSTISFK